MTGAVAIYSAMDSEGIVLTKKSSYARLKVALKIMNKAQTQIKSNYAL